MHTLVFVGVVLASMIAAAATAAGPHRPALPITVRLWPHPRWDPQQSYAAARVVATRAVRVCVRMNGDDECAEARDAWSTVTARDTSWGGYGIADAIAKHRPSAPHLRELYRTYDNRTYEELPLASAQREDLELLEQARIVARGYGGKFVMRWDKGRLWSVPPAHWNGGERALHSAAGVRTVWIKAVATDDRPLYLPSDDDPKEKRKDV